MRPMKFSKKSVSSITHPSHPLLSGCMFCYGNHSAAECGIKEVTSNMSDNKAVDHPDHYGGADNPYEVIRVIRAWDLDFWMGNTVKYIARAGKKDPNKKLEDLEKARWYLDDKIKELKS